MTEQALRQALRAWLIPRLDTNDLMVEELGIENGTTRIDLAVASDRLLGFEIKSDFDNIDRLAHQMHAYHRVFDRLTIVTTERFLDAVTALLPNWWGISIGVHIAGATKLQTVREASLNPRQEVRSMAALLWRDEAFALLSPKMKVSSRANRARLYELIADSFDLDQLRPCVIQTLREREVLRARDWRIKASAEADVPSVPNGDWWHHAAMS
ncbi:MAG: sce7726 family protein [Xanthomonadaceae bacterium]|nr:sce7726 family protein [Xanthomonadaceae bacterium]